KDSGYTLEIVPSAHNHGQRLAGGSGSPGWGRR
ncbi:hypothetical protein Q604_UNBC03181G0001, partial [human gut metagenome]